MKSNAGPQLHPTAPAQNARSTGPAAVEAMEVRQEKLAEDRTVLPAKDITCPNSLVVRPALTETEMGGSFTESELSNAANVVAGAVAERIAGVKIIDAKDLPSYWRCNCVTVLLTLIGYRREPSSLGRSVGNLSLEIAILGAPSEQQGISILVQSTGEKEYGTTKPMETAFAAAAPVIRRVLKQHFK